LAEWFRDIYFELDHDEKIAWLELRTLANITTPSCGGQVNFVSLDQIAAILSVDEQVLARVLQIGQAKAKIEVFEKAIVPASISLLRKPSVRSWSKEAESRLDAELIWTKYCARYRSILFPGIFEYFREKPRDQEEHVGPTSLGEQEMQAINGVLAEARDLLQERLEATTFGIPPRQILERSPIRSCKPEELPASVFLFDEAFGNLDYLVLDRLDKAFCTWGGWRGRNPEKTAGLLMAERRGLLDGLSRFLEYGTPSVLSPEHCHEDILEDLF
jgi:hypothetical protein